MIIIDLLAIDLAAGRHWIELVVEELRAQRLAEVRADRAHPGEPGVEVPPRK
jgi:hypothetical protein